MYSVDTFMYLALQNILGLRMVFSAGNIKQLAVGKSDKETWLNYTIQPFARQFFDVISSVRLLEVKYFHFFSF